MTDYRLNPDWYRAKYYLASQYANWASDPGGGEKAAHLASAEQCATELIAQIDETLGKRRWGREAASSDVEALRAFIADKIRPPAKVLLAEIALARQAPETSGAEEAEVKEVEPTVEETVQEVEEEAPGTSELSYSLARFYAQANREQLAQEYLEAAIEKAEPDGWQALAHRIVRDPVLFEVTPPSTRSVEGFSSKLATARDEAGVEAQAGAQAEAQNLD
jgi:predicted Zn-dependent protease